MKHLPDTQQHFSQLFFKKTRVNKEIILFLKWKKIRQDQDVNLEGTKTKTETSQVNSTEKAVKENPEISLNLLNELTLGQLIQKIDIDDAKASTGFPTVTENKTVTETNAERSGTPTIKFFFQK